MIWINGKQVAAMWILADGVSKKAVSAMWLGGVKIWEAVSSWCCFSAGAWHRDRPWKGADPWRGKPK